MCNVRYHTALHSVCVIVIIHNKRQVYIVNDRNITTQTADITTHIVELLLEVVNFIVGKALNHYI